MTEAKAPRAIVLPASSNGPLCVDLQDVTLSHVSCFSVQDVIVRGSKSIPLYSRVTEAKAPRAIVLPASSNGRLCVDLRDGDLAWDSFLGKGKSVAPNPGVFEARRCAADATTNILFSSGTTGDVSLQRLLQRLRTKCPELVLGT
jgi:acyl-coenzyme A synthetase/AMP-(fatty) acid ligase